MELMRIIQNNLYIHTVEQQRAMLNMRSQYRHVACKNNLRRQQLLHAGSGTTWDMINIRS